MNNNSARCLVLAMASQARIEAMKAENDYLKHVGGPPAYGEDAFNIEANQLEMLAREIGEWSYIKD